MDSSSSSKVTVEYHDPAGVFPLVSPNITSRLPLRNLNWQSPSRPLRQIKSLHLDFVPDDFTKASLRPPTAQTESDGGNSFDLVRNQVDPKRKDGRERRHQIPGLQTSPYLKIYVLRCDDKDAYKSTERGKIRQWIRDNAASSSSSKKNPNQNENHSASEYLILHVVVPDTTAASEPRWRESQREPDELKERKQGAKWPGKSTRTVFDKLRADFNDSSKTDRVAQLRLSKDNVPADLLPTPAQAVTYNETAEEQGKTWNDLLTKLKNLILIPFDKRVRQYEQDIAEQESRRSLPGFNFCTFFIHKEGLARALEAIGLVEDALVIYDELSLGLESVLRDLAGGEAEVTATTFAPYTDDVRERILGSGKSRPNGSAHGKSHNRDDSEIIDSGEIDYRERIVRSNISVFDFQCYLLSRRKALILRLANAITARRQLGAHTKEGGEDLVLISEVCWRASNFLHNTSRVLRQDLNRAKGAGKAELTNAGIDALVCGWLYTVAGQILDETAASALEPQPEHGRKESLKSPPDSLVTSPTRRSEFSDLGSATAYPQRTTSLPARKSRVSELQNSRQSMHSASEETLVSPPSSSGTDGTKTVGQLPGLPELVAYRAELVMMRRKMLEQLAAQRGWLAGWASARAARSTMAMIDLNGSTGASSNGDTAEKAAVPSDLLTPELRSSLLSQEIFYEAYDHLSDQAMRYYHSATQTKSAEAIVGDLAILKHQQGDHEFAAKYFEHVLPIYREEGWTMMEVTAMQVLRVCFKELGRRNDEANILLDLVQKQILASKAGQAAALEIDNGATLEEVVALSQTLDKELVVPAAKYFGEIKLDREVVHFGDHDGFALKLHLQHLLEDDLVVNEVIARLVHLDDPSQELCLMRDEPFTLRKGRNDIQMESRVTAFGPNLIDSVIVKAKNIHFTHEFQPTKEVEQTALGISIHNDNASGASERHDRPWVFVYPAQHAFNAEASLARTVHIDKPRHLEIHLSSGWNEIQSLDLRLKPASAGLRLHLADAQLENIHLREGEEAKAGSLAIGNFALQKDASLTVPYSLDHSGVRELTVHLTAQYHTARGSFIFLNTVKLPAELPLDVDVNDIFHNDALFSNFAIRATSKSPLTISEAELQPSKAYNVEAPPNLGAMTVFENHPAKLAYKITRTPPAGSGAGKIANKDAALALGVKYVVVDELIAQTLRESFKPALDESPFAAFGRLLCPLISMRVKQLLSSEDIHLAALLGEARIPDYNAMGWREVANILPDVIRFDLMAWLKRWHDNNTSLALQLEEAPEDRQRSITISVEVPSMDFVHRATISILDPVHQLEDGEQVFALGEPVTAELNISSTTSWSSESVLNTVSSDGQESARKEARFIYDIQADSETWLVGGPKRGHLTACEGSQATFTVTLLPLKLGTLSLPQVDVQPASPSSEGQNGEQEGRIRCETHCASAGQVVKVIRDQRRTRVHIPEAGRVSEEHVRSGSVFGTPGKSRPGAAETVKETG